MTPPTPDDFKARVQADAKKMAERFTEKELAQITIAPLFYNYIAWNYAMAAVNQAVYLRVPQLKAACRAVRKLHTEYEHFILKDLPMRLLNDLNTRCDKFLDDILPDIEPMFYAVNAEIKRAMPEYKYDTVRTFAVIAMLFICAQEEHTARMDKVVAAKMPGAAPTIQNPMIRGLKVLLYAMAGLNDAFNVKNEHIALSVKIIVKRMSAISLDIA